MRFRRSGDGEPLVLLHGIGSRFGVFDPVAALAAQHYDVISPDLPGFATSAAEGASVDGSIEGYADAVEKLLSELGIDRCHLAGNSMGGGIALELAARGVALSVTAFAPIGFWGKPGLVWCRAAVRTMRAVGALSRPALPVIAATAPGRIALFGTFYGRPGLLSAERGLADVDGLVGATGVADALRGFGQWQVPNTAALREIPVTIAWGSRDRLLTYATQSRRARWLMPRARHITLPGCGHLPFADDPIACFEALVTTCRATEESA